MFVHKITLSTAGMLLAAFVILSSAVALAQQGGFASNSHPAASASPREVPENYGTPQYGNPASWSLDDLSFGSPRPERRALSAAERYVLAGADKQGRYMQPWYMEVLDVVQAYEARTGSVPRVLSPDVMTTVLSNNWPNTAAGQRLISPISGRLPRLDAQSFSAGDLYIRPLSSAELSFYASRERHSLLYELVNQGRVSKYVNGRSVQQPARLLGKVWYVRVYGHDKVIYENIVFSYAEGK